MSLAECDDVFDDVLPGAPDRGLLCRYDRRRWNERAIDEMRPMHDTELVSPAVYDDNLLRITGTARRPARLAGEVDHSNRPRIRTLLETMLDQALRSHSAPTDITLDLSSLRFLDVAGAVSLVHAAEEFPSTHRLRADRRAAAGAAAARPVRRPVRRAAGRGRAPEPDSPTRTTRGRRPP